MYERIFSWRKNTPHTHGVGFNIRKNIMKNILDILKNRKIITNKTPIYNRRIIKIVDLEKPVEFKMGFNFEKNLKEIIEIPVATINYSYENFNFPPQHPQEDIIYSSTDFEPNYYIPLSTFHQYSFNLKQSSFVEMCAHLGAKEIILVDETIDNKKTKLKIDLEINSSNTFENEFKTGEFNSEKIRFLFPKPSEKKTTHYKSKWIESEPTWKTLQKLRLENNVSEYTAELNYTDEMGINLELATKFLNKGLNIGGSFEKIKKTKRIYKVIFWN